MPPSKADFAKIHIAKKELGLSEEAYRDILGFNFGVASAKDLSAKQVRELLELFRSKGWKPKAATKPHKNSDFIAIKPGPSAKQQRKVLAQWHELGYPMAKLHARCKKQFGVERFEWMVDHGALHILITDLDKRISRAKRESVDIG